MNEGKTFVEQIEGSLNGTFPFYSSLKVCDTPQILLDVGCEQLPMLYTQKHLKNALKPDNKKQHSHGLDIEQIKILPKLIENPVMIYDSLSRNDSVVVVTTEFDKSENPIIVSVKPNGRGRYELETIESNFITSVHGRENFIQQIKNATKQEKILFCDKEKSQEMFERWGLQLSELTNILDFNIIIHKSNNIVNSFSEKNSDKSENFCLFEVETHTEHSYFYDKNCLSIDELVKKYADCNGYYPDFIKNCERIDCGRYAGMQQNDDRAKPLFSAEFNVDNDALIVSIPDDRYKNYEDVKYKYIHMNLSDAVKYANDYGKIPKTDKEKIMMKCQSAKKWSETMNQRIEKELSPLGTEKGER